MISRGCLLVFVIGCSRPAPVPPRADRIVVENVGFATPESVLYDAASDTYLVSNIHGTQATADDNGFISKLAPDGRVIALKWIDGASASTRLDAPTGMTIADGMLYVADISVVRTFDATTGAPLGEIAIAGTSFLNDITPAPGGGVFVTDSGLDPADKPTGTDALYRISVDGHVTQVVKSQALGVPNGVVAHGDGVWIVSYGSGELYEITAAGEQRGASKLPKGGLDGIVVHGNEVLVSSWEGKTVFAGTGLPGAPWRDLALAVPAPADIGWDSKRGRLLVPLFEANAVHVITLARR